MANKNIGRARILQEMKNMEKDKVQYLHAEPLQTDLYTWHFTFRGPENTDFHEGLYHGQIILPFEYPFKPPDIIFANKNGRFEVNTKICLTITQFHTEEWNSAWTIRTMLQAVVSLFNERVMGHGYLQSSGQARRYFAKASQDYVCQKCGKICQIVKPRPPMQKVKQINEKAEQKIEQPEQNIPTKQLKNQKTQNAKKIFKQYLVDPLNSKINSNQSTIPQQSNNEQFGSQTTNIPQSNLSRTQTQQQNQQKMNSNNINSTQKVKTAKKQQIRQPTSQDMFYQLLLQGNQEYVDVIKSKKYVS